LVSKLGAEKFDALGGILSIEQAKTSVRSPTEKGISMFPGLQVYVTPSPLELDQEQEGDERCA
jgi:hypothetical protein